MPFRVGASIPLILNHALHVAPGLEVSELLYTPHAWGDELGAQRLVVVRQNVHHMLATLHHKVLAVGAFWDNPKIKPDRPTLRVAVARQRRHWFEGLWANAGEPVTLKQA